MDVNSKEAELWSETMRLKSLVEHRGAEIERLTDDLAASERLREHAVKELGKESARIARLEAAVEQALDDMGEKGLSVCQQAKEMLQAALAGTEGT